MASFGIDRSPLGGFSVNQRNLIEQVNDVVGGALGCRDVGDEAENVAGLNATERYRLHKGNARLTEVGAEISDPLP